MLNLPLGVHLGSDGRLYGAVVAAAAVVAIGGGLSPVHYLVRFRLSGALAGTSASHLRPERVRALIVGLQVALAVWCLISATALARGAERARAVDVGFDLGRLLTLSGRAVGPNWSPADAAAYWDAALARVASVPDVEATAFAGQVFGNSSQFRGIRAGDMVQSVLINKTSSDYFATAGVPLVRGRAYSDEEVRANAPVAVISRQLADALGGLDAAIGAMLRFASASTGEPPLTVIGVAGNVTGTAMGLGELSRPIPTLYQPLVTTDLPRAFLIIRVQGARATLKRNLERVLPASLPERPATLAEAGVGLAGQIQLAQQPAQFASLAGVALVLLTMVGLHGLVSLVVRLRIKDLAVRTALGARPSAVALAAARPSAVALAAMRPALVPTVCGIVAGAMAALATLQRISPVVLYGVPIFDLWSWSAAVAVLAVGLGIGVLHPLAQLGRVTPATVLKTD